MVLPAARTTLGLLFFHGSTDDSSMAPLDSSTVTVWLLARASFSDLPPQLPPLPRPSYRGLPPPRRSPGQQTGGSAGRS
jgi:hypothetical protein